MKNPIFALITLLLSAALSLADASVAVAGAEAEPHPSKGVADKDGPNVKGESNDFKSYLNEEDDEEKESNSLDLVDLGDDAKIAVGGDDPSLGLKAGF